jgi:fructokinase
VNPTSNASLASAVAPNSGTRTATPEVIVIGEALMDVVASPDGTVEHPGGSPSNVAYGLGLLGIRTSLLTSIGDDDRGQAIEAHLQRAGVALLPGSRTPGRTATATATLAADGSATYDFDIRWDLPPAAPVSLPKVLHTGSIATFLAPGAAAVRTLLEQAHRECLVTYDPNVRPALLGSQAEARTIFEELVPLTDVVKLSDEDARWLYPGLQLEDTAARILELGAGLAVVTRGAEGSLLATPELQLAVPAVRSTVADTIGAGDSYMAALIYGLLARGSDGLAPAVLETLGRTASKAAAITVGRPGANPPTVAELLADLREDSAVLAVSAAGASVH